MRTRPVAEEAGRVEVRGLTKRFGGFTAVDDLSFTVEAGRITGFLGPNGAGKTTTLRMLLGLVRPTAGTATIGGLPYRDLRSPLTTVGAALEATDFHPGRTGRDHLRVLATAGGLPMRRVDELLELVGIPAFAGRRAGAYSMGMRQRLALAAALLGDPQVLILDEPGNGLDPEGIRWLRGFLRHLSRDEHKTVLVSSHLLQEVEQTADEVVIIANGRLVRAGTVADLAGGGGTLVRAADLGALARALEAAGLDVRRGSGGLLVATDDPARVGEIAFSAGLPLSHLGPHEADLEKLFFDLTEGTNRNLSGTLTGVTR